MLRFSTRSGQVGDLPEPMGKNDPGLAGHLKGIALGGTPVIAVHAAKSARSGFLDRLLPVLGHERVRPALVSSLDGREIDLATLMDQVIGRVCADQIDRLERCHAALTILAPGENRIALVIDDAHLLTEQCVRYLDLMASITRSSQAPLLIVLVGSPAIWDRLPLTGGLAAANVARRLTLNDAMPLAEPAADPAAESVGRSLQIVDMVRAARMVPMLLPPERPKRGWFAVAACAGSFAAVGGFAAGLYLDGLLPSSRALWPRVMITQASTVATPRFRTAVATPLTPASPVAAVQQVAVLAPPAAPHDDAVTVDAALATAAAVSVKAEEAPMADQVPTGVFAPVPLAPLIVSATAAEVVTTGSEGAPFAYTAEPPTVAPALVSVTVPPAPVVLPRPVTRVATAAPATVPPVSPTLVAPTPVAPASVALASVALASVAPASVAPTPVAPPPMEPGMVAILIERGDALLATGDITAARLMYGRAADTQSILGVVAMGMTFDPTVLAQIGAQGLSADTQLAAMWYQRAAALGSSDAVRLLRRLRSEDARQTGLSGSTTHRSDPGR